MTGKDHLPFYQNLQAYYKLGCIQNVQSMKSFMREVGHTYIVSCLPRLRKSALLSLKSKNKEAALRHIRLLKLTSETREKCTSLLNRVEEVLSVIENAESTKQVWSFCWTCSDPSNATLYFL